MPKFEYLLTVDGHPVNVATTVKPLLGSILEPFIPSLHYMSTDAIMDLCIGFCELLEGAGEPTGRCRRVVEHVFGKGKHPTREQAMALVTDFYLNFTGMGRLPHFGMAHVEKNSRGNFRIISRSFINPEKDSVNRE